MVNARANPDGQVNIAMVGKYVQIRDSYMSLQRGADARRAEYAHPRQHPLHRVRRHRASTAPRLAGHGRHPGAGRLRRARHRGQDPGGALCARARIPYLGICLGMQVAIVEFGRNVLGLNGANSTEFNRATPHPVIALISEWQDQARGTQMRDERLRQGRHHAPRRPGSAARRRHPRPRDLTARTRSSSATAIATSSTTTSSIATPQAGMRFSGFSRDDLVEVIEIAGPPLVRRDPVPSRVHLDPARRPSALHRLHPRRTRPAGFAPAAGRGRVA